MFKEILTLQAEEGPLQYYLLFEKEGRRFIFDPTFKNKSAPVFVILVEDDVLYTEGKISHQLEMQAQEHVRGLLTSGFLDRL